MQKKLIALAVAGIMAAPMAAQAGVEVYGKARLSVGMVGNGAAAGSEDSKLSVTSHASRLGFKGSEDLGGGLTAVWQVEHQMDMDDNSNTNAFDSQRNTFVGVAGDFGTVVLGRHDTPYKMATKDIMGDTYGDYNAVINATHDMRSDNVIAYVSPAMGAVSYAVAYVPDINSDDLPDATLDDDNDAVSLMVKYSEGDLGLSFAHQSASNFSGTDSADAMKLGLTYDLGATDLTVIFESTEVGASDQDNFYFGVDHALGGDSSVKLAIGQAGEVASVSDTGGTFLALAWVKKLSDNAEWYAMYSSMSLDSAATGGIVGVAGTADEAATAIAAGINLKFSSM